MTSPRYCLFGTKPSGDRKLVALFGSEQQLLAYVSWATLQATPEGKRKFEQGSALVGCDRYDYSAESDSVGEVDVPFNPSPSML